MDERLEHALKWCKDQEDRLKLELTNRQKYRIVNKKHFGSYIEKWKKDNPERVKAISQRGKTKRRARSKLLINTLTAGEWIDILIKYKFRCAYCGKEFTLFDRETKDHVIPISKNGRNTKENVVPACRSCNSKKHDTINHRWYKRGTIISLTGKK